MYSLVYFRIVSARMRGLGHGFILNVPPHRRGASPNPTALPQKQDAVRRERAGLLHGPQRNAGHAALRPARESALHVRAEANYATIGTGTRKRRGRLQSAAAAAGSGGRDGRFPAVIDHSPLCSGLPVDEAAL